ncbi:MAG: cation:proton antiporter [Gammaproteobacteria bacterium]
MGTTEISIFSSIFMIFLGAAILATVVLHLKQSLLIAYILLGILIGPHGLKLISDPGIIKKISDFGILFLLFLMGLDLHPQHLVQLIKNAAKITIASSFVFFMIGFLTSILLNFNYSSALIMGIASMFSSTILSLKMLPNDTWEQKTMNEMIISVLLLQDILAISVLLFLGEKNSITEISIWVKLITGFIGLCVLVFCLERYVLIKLINKFSNYSEYIFLLAIAWCLSISELAKFFGLSHEIGAFVAGVAMASSSISLYIADSLKPLRDFFLILFFFSLGATLNLKIDWINSLQIGFLLILFVGIKPLIFKYCVKIFIGAQTKVSNYAKEIGYRLGNGSEFSLLLTELAANYDFINQSVSDIVQIATIMSFIISSFVVIFLYPPKVNDLP